GRGSCAQTARALTIRSSRHRFAARLNLGVRTQVEVNDASKKKFGAWFWVAIFAVLSLLHLLGWYRKGDALELVRAIGFALLIPLSWLFPAWPRSESSAAPKGSAVRSVSLTLWLVGASMVIYALVRSWL